MASILKQGGLMSQDSNPGAATPYSLYKLYSKQAAATANPFTLRQVGNGLSLNSVVSQSRGAASAESKQPLLGSQSPQLLGLGRASTQMPGRPATGGSARRPPWAKRRTTS